MNPRKIFGAAFVSATMACTGQIGGPSGSSASPPSGVSNGNGGSASGGSGPVGTGPTDSGPRDPNRVTIRRLNRAEYDNTVRDLLHTEQTPGQTKFINDTPQLGFDNDGAQQTLSPVQFTLYQAAAESLAAEVMTNAVERAQIVTCDLKSGATCASTIISTFGQRALRRPLTPAEVSGYVGLMGTAAQAGASADEQLQTVLESMLVSPSFLFRPELDTDPTSATPHLLAPFEMASRLSYAVLRSMPDQLLFDAASAGKLAEVSDVQSQLQRLLASSNNAFATTFPEQWLGTTGIPLATFDATLFPAFNPAVASSMAAEVTAFFGELLQQNPPLTQLLTADFTYLDKNLATLYGLPAPGGSSLTRSMLNTPQRGGLLTMGAVLAATSYPSRTSLVKRGAWLLGQLLCAPTPAPPPDIPAFPEDNAAAKTQKEILLQHRSNPACAACHDSMDNIGTALENYDAIGAYRTTQAGVTIDASGKLAGAIANPGGKDGPSFTGARELAAAVAADPRFASCVAERVLSYSLGRATVASDSPYVQDLIKVPASGALGLRDIVMNVVASDTFRMRRGEPATTEGMP